ncbi:MAG: Hsp20/alpha crystallin family protein [Acidobacteria bacterium]|nr:MAG: Hsp20/alpha crystallin family protein [Acidobacteriota bacterium]
MPEPVLIAEDARRLLDELDRDVPGAAHLSAECRPALDILETTDATEVVVDVPGVPAKALRVAIRANTVMIVGAKLVPTTPANARFHLAERTYGRFARAVRIAGAFDAQRAKALVENGLLRIVLPRIEDRRGRLVDIEVESA